VKNILRQQEHFTFVDAMADFPALLHGVHKDMPMQLIEDFIPGIDMEVIARVRTFDHLKDKIRVLEDLPITNRAQRGRKMLLDPGFEIKRARDIHTLLHSEPYWRNVRTAAIR
jgi:hypothetical protein